MDEQAAAIEAPTSRRAARRDWPTQVDRGVVVAVTLAGLLCPQGPTTWYLSLLIGFAGIAGALLGGALVTTSLSERQTDRLQGPRRKPAMIGREAIDTTIAAWIAATLLAWPMSRWFAGAPTGLVWSLEQAGGGWLVAGQTLLGVLALDAWLYWKHRILHSRLLFPFHREHHVFRDPTAFAGFAVGPVESVLTFWPVVLVGVPEAIHYGPLYLSLVVGFISLNFYLHCGVQLRVLERVLPRLWLNTSVFHNRHHARAEVNFGEALTLWDHLCGTGERKE